MKFFIREQGGCVVSLQKLSSCFGFAYVYVGKYMTQKTKTLQPFILRLLAVLLHALLNFIAISYLLDFDITGSWLVFIGFVLLVFLLVYLFLRHIISFIQFIKKQ